MIMEGLNGFRFFGSRVLVELLSFLDHQSSDDLRFHSTEVLRGVEPPHPMSLQIRSASEDEHHIR